MNILPRFDSSSSSCDLPGGRACITAKNGQPPIPESARITRGTVLNMCLELDVPFRRGNSRIVQDGIARKRANRDEISIDQARAELHESELAPARREAAAKRKDRRPDRASRPKIVPSEAALDRLAAAIS